MFITVITTVKDSSAVQVIVKWSRRDSGQLSRLICLRSRALPAQTQQRRGIVQPGFAAPLVPACSGVHQHKGSYSFHSDSPCQSVKVMSLLCHGKAKPKKQNNLSSFLSHICLSLEESCIWSRWRKMFHSLIHQIPLLVYLFLVVTGTLYWTQAIQSAFNPRGCNRGCLLLLIHTVSLFHLLTTKLIKSISTFLFKEKIEP